MSDADAPQAPESLGLDALAAQAVELETGALPPGMRPPEPAQVIADSSAELLGALTMARLLVAPMFEWWPKFGDTWSDGTLQGISTAGAQVMERHGWSLGDLMSSWGPYIALALATAPPTMVTLQAIKAEKARQAMPRAEPAEAEEGVRP